MSDLIEQTEALAHRLVENERDILKALHDVSLASCRVWKRCAEKAEAERDEWKDRAERPWANARKTWEEHYNAEHKRAVAIEATTIERCVNAVAEILPEGGLLNACQKRIRALKPSGDPCETQSERPVNQYLLGGSSTQSEG